MHRQLVIFLSAILVSCGTFAQVSSAVSPSPEQLIAAKRYATVIPIKSIIDRGLAMSSKKYPEQYPPDFRSTVLSQVRLSSLEDKYIEILINTFSTAELNALAEFYSTSIGRSTLEKTEAFSLEFAPFLIAELSVASDLAHRVPTLEGKHFASEVIKFLSQENPRLEAAVLASNGDYIRQFGRRASEILSSNRAYFPGPGPTKQFPECTGAINGTVALLSQLRGTNLDASAKLFSEKAEALLSACKNVAGTQSQ